MMPIASKYLELVGKLYPVYSNGKDFYYFHYRGSKMRYDEVRDGQLLTAEVAKMRYPEYFI